MYVEVLIVVVSLFCMYKYRDYKRYSQLPGPRGKPFIGNSLDLDLAKPHVSFAKWAKEYGSVYKLHLAGSWTVIVQGTEELHHMFVKKGVDFSNRINTYRVNKLTKNRSEVAFADYDEKFKYLKKLMFKGLRQHNLKHIEEITIDVVNDMMHEIKSLDGKSFDPASYIFPALFQILYVMVFSHKVDKSNPELQLLREIDEEAVELLSFAGTHALLDFFPWLRFFGNKTYKELVQLNDKMDMLFETFITKILNEEMEGGWFKDLLEIHTQDTKRLTKDNIRMLTLQFFTAGSATTSTTLMAFTNLMVHNPEVFKKLQAEVDSKIEESGKISFSDRACMPFTYACVLETLRYVSAVSLGVPHVTTCDTSLKGYAIPKGTTVMTNLWGQHHDPELFPEPFQFKPERFLEGDGNLIASGKSPRRDLFPFGAGIRVCTGEALAMTRLFIMVALLAQHFHILPATTIEEQPSIHPLDFKLGAVLFPQSFKIRMIPRE